MMNQKSDGGTRESPKVNNIKKAARRYVGGNWETAGKKQFDLLIEEGLKPEHTLLEIGCGNFRAGRYFIEYLVPGKYYGVEHHSWLLDAGVEEIGDEIINKKAPTFIISDDFDFGSTSKTINFALAKSVFTHLTKDKIKQCLDNLEQILDDDGAFYASISLGNSKNNPGESNDTKRFCYSLEEIGEIAQNWMIESLKHRGCHKQTMLKFVKIKK